MTKAEVRRIGYAGFFTGVEGCGARLRRVGPARSTPTQEVVAVDVRIRPREAGVLYTQGLQVSPIAQGRMRLGLIMDCYA